MANKGYVCSSKTKQRIYNVAADLFLNNGYETTTLKDIAEAADVSTGTLYRYYPSKGDFLVEIGRVSVQHLRAFMQELPESMPVDEAVLAVLMEDIKGTQHVFFAPDTSEESFHQKRTSDIRLAYNKRNLRQQRAPRHRAGHARRTRGHLRQPHSASQRRTARSSCTANSTVMAQIIVAIFFRELDKGMYRYDYPYEMKFKEKLDILFEGRLHAPADEAPSAQ